jgi:hypothetical protein
VSISSPFPTALNPIFSCHEPCKCKSMNTFCQLSTLTGSLCPSFRSDFVWELLTVSAFCLIELSIEQVQLCVVTLMQVTDDGPHVIQDHLSRQKLTSTWIQLIRGVMCFSVCYDVWKQKNLWNWLEAGIGTIETEEDQNCMWMLAKQKSPPIWVDVMHAISSK